MKSTPLTLEQKTIISNQYATTLNRELATLAGCTVPQVKYLAYSNKLHKTAAHISAAASAKKTEYIRSKPKKTTQPSKRKVVKPEQKAVVRPWRYPTTSPQYKEWMAGHLAGKTRTAVLDANNRTAYVWRKTV